MAVVFTAFALAVPAAYAAVSSAEETAADQVLTWTAGDDYMKYTSAPATAVAGKATIVFDNSTAAGNTTGLTHTLTFDTSNPDYNNDVSLNILASPFDSQGGRHTTEVTLTPGVYRYFCAMPGHQMMVGELVVTSAPGDDTTAPDASATVSGMKDDAGNYVSSATVTLTASDTESGVATIEYSLDGAAYTPYTTPIAVNTVGQHTLTYRATDKAGNTSTAKTLQFTITAPEPPKDTTAPDTSATVTGTKDNNGNYVSNATITLTASDTESGVATIEYSLDGAAYTPYTTPIAVNTVGQHTLTYRATDKAGNTSTAKTLQFTITAPEPPKDTTAPDTSATVTGTKDNNGNYVSNATITLTASDTESGVATIEYSLDGAAYTPYTTPIAVNTVGQHTLTYRATDKAGNTSTAKTLQFTITAPEPPKDTTAPDTSATVTGTKDNNGNYVSNATITLTASDTESGVATIEYSLDGAAYTPYTTPIAVNTVGQHTLTYRATDKAGNTSAAQSVNFTVVAAPPQDRTPPQVSASVSGTKNDAGDYVGRATVTVTASDAESGVARIEYSLDGGPYLQYSAPVAIDRAGSHTLLYRASDKVGNTSTPQSLSLTVVDSEPPTDCPEADGRSTVFTGSINTGVPNRVTANGCTINELIEDHRAWKNHGTFVSHVGEVVTTLRKQGVIDQREAAAIKKAAGQSDVGTPDHGPTRH
ncbi:OmpL47-type beta-barrel domain-containing protein [Streptomyces sp. SCL15-6]|uniref:OmpL47-type beta-barrel domain-containing protein n=1 Tax=Streptomyces sp. SCL15-6 TaxID=2967222 RepID=UPI002966D36F|nr:Ig-like domain repeat protein [Streptomyces sp. SCL15-6]